MEKEFLESGGEFENIALKELFVIKGNPQLNKDSFTFSASGEYPYFTRTVLNNGIAGYVEYLDDEHKVTGNCLAVGMLGMQFFYMEKDFYAGQFTKSAYPIKNKIGKFNKNIAQYFIVLLNRYQKVFQGMLVRDFEKTFYNSEVCLPIRDGKVDLIYIEKYMRELQKERVRELQLYLNITGLSSYELTDDEINVMGGGNIIWDNYRIGDLFVKLESKFLLKGDKFKFVSKQRTDEFNVPTVYAKFGDNGIMYWSKQGDFQTHKNTLSIIYNGVISAGTVYAQPYDTAVLAESYLIDLLNNKPIFESYLFMSCVMNKVLYPKYSREYLATWAGKVENDIIPLPTKNNQIDYDYMATFIKAIQKLIIKDLVLYTERELKAYEQVID